MKDKILPFLLLPLPLVLIFGFPLHAQRAIDVSYVQDAQGSYVFSCTNHAFCNYVLTVEFTTLENAKSDHLLPYQAQVKPGVTKLFKLSKQQAGGDVRFKYSVDFFKGCINPSVDTGITYLLPISPGKEAQAYELRNLPRPQSGEPPTKTFYTIRLKMHPGDTLFAARRGTVVAVDVSSDVNDLGGTSSGDEDYVEIVHRDCSFGHYGTLKKDGAFVKPGQVVEAGQPIGIIGGDRYGRGSEARIGVYYNESPDDAPAGNGKVAEIGRIYVPLKFWTKKNGSGMLRHGASYTSEFPAALLTQETGKPRSSGKRRK